MNYIFDFKKIRELSDFQKILGDVQSIEKGQDKSIPASSETHFSFDGTKFKRIVEKIELTKEEQEAYDAYIASSSMFFERSTYVLEYHFPKAVKSTTAKGASFSDDKKIMYLKKPFQEVIDTPEDLDFEVILVD